MKNNIKFDTKFGYKIPDYVHMICLDCASHKAGMLRPRNYPMQTMCDMCETRKKEVYNTNDFDWSEYTVEKREQIENANRAMRRAKSENPAL